MPVQGATKVVPTGKWIDLNSDSEKKVWKSIIHPFNSWHYLKSYQVNWEKEKKEENVREEINQIEEKTVSTKSNALSLNGQILGERVEEESVYAEWTILEMKRESK